MASRKRRRAVQIGIPALVIGVLTFVALWRVGTPGPVDSTEDTMAAPPAMPPLTHVADVLRPTSIGQRATLERVRILATPSARTLWIGSDAARVFVVLDPDVKQSHEARVTTDAPVTLIGLVRRAPAPEEAVRQWAIDAATAETVRDGGIYLHVTEVRP